MSQTYKALKGIGKDFTVWAAVDGLPHVGMANATWLRLIWAAILGGAATAFIYQFAWQVIPHYFSHPTNVNTAIQYGQRVFPSVTFCFLNPWKASKIAGTPLQSLASAYVSNNANSTYGFTSPLNILRQQRATKWMQLMSEELINLDQSNSNSTDISYTYDDLFISCSYNMDTCNETNFYEFFDPFYGRCYTFNNDGNYMSSRASPTYGLRVVLRVNRADFLPWITSTGMAVYIHNKGQTPFVETKGYYIPVGKGSSLGVRFLSKVKLPHPYSTCTFNGAGQKLYYTGRYDIEACFRSCIQDKIIKECGCYDPSYNKPSDGTAISCYNMANPNAAIDCIWSITNTDGKTGFNVNKGCSCPVNCETDTYKTTMSTAEWPAAKYTPHECIVNSSYSNNWDNGNSNNVGWNWGWLGGKGGPKKTTTTTTTTTTPKPTAAQSLASVQSCMEWYKQNTLLTEVYYERMDYEVDTETPAYTFIMLISDLGGQIGFWLGMSVISVIEIFTFFLLVACYFCTPKKERPVVDYDFDFDKPPTTPTTNTSAQNQPDPNSLYNQDKDFPLPPPIQNPH